MRFDIKKPAKSKRTASTDLQHPERPLKHTEPEPLCVVRRHHHALPDMASAHDAFGAVHQQHHNVAHACFKPHFEHNPTTVEVKAHAAVF
jgi:hypothetical protein